GLRELSTVRSTYAAVPYEAYAPGKPGRCPAKLAGEVAVRSTERPQKRGGGDGGGEAETITANQVRSTGHGISGRLDRESGRRDADPVFQLCGPHQKFSISFREWRHRLWAPGQA